jgi:hypothetical protein|tara:strand:+ start:1589 stop:2233 length:645 start_codon:yes stop_codon:yes gene_type:complete
MSKHFIIDFETIGQNSREVPAIDCSYTTFDWERFTENPYSFAELVNGMEQAKFDIKDQMTEHGCTYNKRDLQWWLDQPPELRQNMKPSVDDLTAAQFMEKLIDYLRSEGKIDYWWSRSNSFDPVILERIAQNANKTSLLGDHLKYWAVRDTRTFIDAKFDFKVPGGKNGFVPVSNVAKWEYNFKAHDSKHDVAADILRLQTIVRAEADLEQIEI